MAVRANRDKTGLAPARGRASAKTGSLEGEGGSRRPAPAGAMNEQVWTTFKAVAEIGSFSKAARHLNLSQSAVSQQIQLLETQYRSPLFIRTSHGVHLTEAGEVVYRYVTNVLRTLEESRRRVSELPRLRERTLLIGASLTIAEYLLPELLKSFTPAHPNLRLTVTMANSSTVVEQVSHHEVDVGLIEARVNDSGLVVRPFQVDEPVVVVRRDHPWIKKAAVRAEDLLAEPVILREPGSGTRWALEEALARRGLSIRELNVAMVLGTTQAIKAMVALGFGYSVLSPLTVGPEERERLALLKVQDLAFCREFSVIYEEPASRLEVSQFVDFVLARASLAATAEMTPG